MNILEEEERRTELRRLFKRNQEDAALNPVLVLWRFPHLESENLSWTFLSSQNFDRAVLRKASWERFEEEAEIQTTDLPLTQSELVEAFQVLSGIEVLGEQGVGIYDGAIYGRELFDEKTAAVTERLEWVGAQTFEMLDRKLPNVLKQKMDWQNVPYQTDI